MKKSQPVRTRTLLIAIWRHISPRRRIQLSLLITTMLLCGVAELVSIGSVIPFLTALTDPSQFLEHPLAMQIAKNLGYTKSKDLVVPVSLLFAIAAAFAALIRLANLRLNTRLAAAIGSDLSCEAYRRTLYQPYEVYLKRSSASIIAALTTHLSRTIVALSSLLQLVTSLVVSIAILAGLFLINWRVALIALLLFGTVYVSLAFFAQKELRKNSKLIAEATQEQIKSLQQGLGAVRDVLLDSNQDVYVHSYRKVDHSQRQKQAENQYLRAFPRFAVEALGLVSIALLGGFLVTNHGPSQTVIPLLGALALGAQRLLPALQQIYSSWATLKGADASVIEIVNMLDQYLPEPIIASSPIPAFHQIRLEDVYFRYDEEQDYILKGVNLEITRGERVALIGPTGSGKSTIVDLLMGLLLPTKGRVIVDGTDIHDPKHPQRLVNLRAAIAHVPQRIYLANSTVAENIAFGLPKDQIDFERMKNVAQQAQISNFIDSMPDCYNSIVGEWGVKLSGGQSQRVGIARALYKRSQILVLDEATSALDNHTEALVMNSIDNLSDDLTVIMIAHRLSTVEAFDRVVKIEHGVVAADGTPQSVLRA